MAADRARYETRTFPSSRRLVIDGGNWGHKKHTIHALAEFDITRARALIRDYKAAHGEGISFTAFIAACAGRAVAEDRNCHAYRRGNKLVIFDDVDIGTLIERDVEGARLATFYVIRTADRKSVRAIHDEIRAAQREPIEAHPEFTRWKAFVRLPAPVRRLFYWRLDRDPELRKRLAGTVTLTAIGMAGKGSGWGVPIAQNTLTITVGGIETKPGVVEGRIEPREFLCTTVSFDHDIVDGVPAARFVARFRALVEAASGIETA